MTTTQEMIFTKPPAALDTCDSCGGSSKALVRVTIQMAGDKTSSLTLCGHHYDSRPIKLQQLIVGVCDTRRIWMESSQKD